MPGAVNTTNASDHIPLCVLCVSLADCIEIGSTSANLMKGDQLNNIVVEQLLDTSAV